MLCVYVYIGIYFFPQDQNKIFEIFFFPSNETPTVFFFSRSFVRIFFLITYFFKFILSRNCISLLMLLKIPATTTRILLNHFKWDKEKLMERFYDGDQEKLFAEARVINPFRKGPVINRTRSSQISLVSS